MGVEPSVWDTCSEGYLRGVGVHTVHVVHVMRWLASPLAHTY